MIATKAHEVAATSQFEKLIDHALAVDPTVDVIAERDDGILGLRVDGLDQGGQGD